MKLIFKGTGQMTGELLRGRENRYNRKGGSERERERERGVELELCLFDIYYRLQDENKWHMFGEMHVCYGTYINL